MSRTTHKMLRTTHGWIFFGACTGPHRELTLPLTFTIPSTLAHKMSSPTHPPKTTQTRKHRVFLSPLLPTLLCFFLMEINPVTSIHLEIMVASPWKNVERRNILRDVFKLCNFTSVHLASSLLQKTSYPVSDSWHPDWSRFPVDIRRDYSIINPVLYLRYFPCFHNCPSYTRHL